MGYGGAPAKALLEAREALSRLPVDIRDFGAKCDNATDDTVAVQAALNSGAKLVTVPAGRSVRLTATLSVPSGVTFCSVDEGKATLRMDNSSVSRVFSLSARTGVKIENFIIQCPKAAAPSDAVVVISGGSSRCELIGCDFIDAASATTGTIVISGSTTHDNTVAHCCIDGAEQVSIGISGAYANNIVNNEIKNGGSFGIRLGEGANRNLVTGNRIDTTTLEAIGIYWNCYQNRILGNHCANSGDNNISVSGYQNIVSGNVCVEAAGSSIGVWGSWNVISGNTCLRPNNALTTFWSGVWINSGYGGTGQNNLVLGNVCDDNRAVPLMAYIVRIETGGYATWAAGQAVVVGDYRVAGLNIYSATTAGTTGATEPVHTTGAVSDGGVTWEYRASFVTTAKPAGNIIRDNKQGRCANPTTPIIDAANWADNFCEDRREGRLAIGGANIGWTTVQDIAISRSGNAGIAIQCGTGSLIRFGFGISGTLAASIEYDTSSSEFSIGGRGNNTKTLRILSNGDTLIGQQAPATTATGGFMHVAAMAGPPTGTPLARSGFRPMVFDTAGKKFWIYDDGAWRGVTLS